MQSGEAFTFLRLRRQRGAELRLAAGALHEYDQLARRFHRHLVAIVLLDQGQRQVDAGRDAGRGPQRSVLDVDPVRIDVYRRMQGGQALHPFPVRGHALAVQLAGRGQQEGAGADGAQPPHGGCPLPHPRDQRRRRMVLLALATTRRDDGVDRHAVQCRQGHRHHLQAGAGGHQAAVGRRHGDLVQGRAGAGTAAAGRGQRLHGAGQVEQVHVLVREHDDVARRLGWHGRRCAVRDGK